MVDDSKVLSFEREFWRTSQTISAGENATVNSCHEKVSLLTYSNKLCERPLGENEARLLDIMIDSISSSSNSMQPVVCRWPTLERLVSVGTCGLDSKSVFLIITPNLGSGNVEDRILYVWGGRSFSCDRT